MPATRAKRPTVRKPVMFLVEDSPADAGLLLEALGDGHELPDVRHAWDARHAWQEIKAMLGDPAERPNLMVLDIGMPGESGLELLAKMRREAPQADWPVVVLTSSMAPIDIDAARRNGAAAYFSKPLTLDGYVELAAQIRSRWLQSPPAPAAGDAKA